MTHVAGPAYAPRGTPAGPTEVRRLPASSAPLLCNGALLARTIVVVSVAHGSDCHGMTADSFTVVSENPALVMVAVTAGSRTHRLLASATGFAVSVLAEEQEEVARHFASRRRPLGVRQFDAVLWKPAPYTGTPVLAQALWWLDCERHAVIAAGDHVLVIGEVVEAGARARPGRPLVRFDGTYQPLHPTPVAHADRSFALSGHPAGT